MTTEKFDQIMLWFWVCMFLFLAGVVYAIVASVLKEKRIKQQIEEQEKKKRLAALEAARQKPPPPKPAPPEPVISQVTINEEAFALAASCFDRDTKPTQDMVKSHTYSKHYPEKVNEQILARATQLLHKIDVMIH